jgi:hypothetical protein
MFNKYEHLFSELQRPYEKFRVGLYGPESGTGLQVQRFFCLDATVIVLKGRVRLAVSIRRIDSTQRFTVSFTAGRDFTDSV